MDTNLHHFFFSTYYTTAMNLSDQIRYFMNEQFLYLIEAAVMSHSLYYHEEGRKNESKAHLTFYPLVDTCDQFEM